MRRTVLWVSMGLVAGLAACGGSSNSGSSCSPAGTWKTTGNVTNTTSSLCAAAASQIGTNDTMTITVNGTTITAKSQTGLEYTGTLDTAKCTAVLTATQSAPVDVGGTTVSLQGTSTANVTFQGSSLTGQQTIDVATTPVTVGTPCTITASINGTKQ